jgi:excisionase family DNA binding protein
MEREEALSERRAQTVVRTAGPTAEERLLTVDDVALRLGRHPDTVREDLRRGRLPGLKLGRSWRIRASDLEERLRTVSKAVEAKRKDRGQLDGAQAWLQAEKEKRKQGRRTPPSKA